MRAVDIIIKKRDGMELAPEEIQYFINGYVHLEIPDYQAAAWAMAVLLRGMTAEETAVLTEALVDSGERLDLSSVVPIAVDKHSTGGVGDKTSLVVLPAVAACGVPVGKMSGRGLGFSGGTLDKMEAIPGFDVNLTTEAFLEQLDRVGLVLSGQTADLAPADGMLYALRDVTGTVPSTPLIASSVMSKKIASGANAIVLDVKVGVGAFMQSLEEGEALAQRMVEIGRHASRKVVALLSDMNQPLGKTVGNTLEVREALETLQGRGPADLVEHCLLVAAHMLLLGAGAETLADAEAAIGRSLQDGSAYRKFEEMVVAQGGDPAYIQSPEKLPSARLVETFNARSSGYISGIHAGEVGLASVQLGAGRLKKGDPIDHAVGIVIERNVGDPIQKGEPLFQIHANDPKRLKEAAERVMAAHSILPDPQDPLPLFYKTLM